MCREHDPDAHAAPVRQARRHRRLEASTALALCRAAPVPAKVPLTSLCRVRGLVVNPRAVREVGEFAGLKRSRLPERHVAAPVVPDASRGRSAR